MSQGPNDTNAMPETLLLPLCGWFVNANVLLLFTRIDGVYTPLRVVRSVPSRGVVVVVVVYQD